MVRNSVLVIRPTSHSCLNDRGLTIFCGTHFEDKISTEISEHEGDLVHSESGSLGLSLGKSRFRQASQHGDTTARGFPQGIIRDWRHTLSHEPFSSSRKRKEKDLETKAKRSLLSALSKTHAVNFLGFTVCVSKDTFTFGGGRSGLLGASGFPVIVYNASL